MTTKKLAGSKIYDRAMDEETHENTYNGFVKFVEISTVVLICWVMSLLIGGVKGAWTTAVLGVIVSAAAGSFGALVPSVGVRAPATIVFALALLLLIY